MNGPGLKTVQCLGNWVRLLEQGSPGHGQGAVADQSQTRLPRGATRSLAEARRQSLLSSEPARKLPCASSPVDQSSGKCSKVSRKAAESDAVAIIDGPHQSGMRKPMSKALPAGCSWVCFGECNPQDPHLSTLASIEPLSTLDTNRPHIIRPSL